MSTAIVRKMTQTMIDATITPTIFPLRFEGWNAPRAGGSVELPENRQRKTTDKCGIHLR